MGFLKVVFFTSLPFFFFKYKRNTNSFSCLTTTNTYVKFALNQRLQLDVYFTVSRMQQLNLRVKFKAVYPTEARKNVKNLKGRDLKGSILDVGLTVLALSWHNTGPTLT